MLVFLCFSITIIGALNWLCIGFFQYDFVAGLFGTQSSIFSRLIYIIIGISAIFLTYAVIRYKGRLTIKKNQNQQEVLLNKQPLPNMVSNNNLISSDTQTQQFEPNMQNQQNSQTQTSQQNSQTQLSQSNPTNKN